MQEPSPNPENAVGRSPAEPEGKSGPPADSRPPQRRANFLDVTLDGMPELEQFPTDAERQAALDEIAKEAANPKSGSYWLAVAILAVAVIVVRTAVKWALGRVVWYYWLEEAILWVSIGVTFWLVLRRLHRWGAPEELRAKLLKAGVPVCMKCGYSLRGLPLASGRCPECGAEFDARVRALLAGGGGAV